MARTIVGILQLLLKQDVTQKAPAVNAAIRSIEQQAQRLGNAQWGAQFQRQLDRLKVSPAERAAIAASYDRLARDINGKINRADLAAWRHGTLAHLAQVRAGIKQTADQAKQMHAAINGAKGLAGNVMKPALVALGAYTGWYAAGVAMREGFNAAGERTREDFRQDMAGIPELEKTRIAAQAQVLTAKYPSVGMTEIMEMARTARNTMGTTEDGLAILEDMVRGLVTLQSSQGVDAGSASMMRLIRGLDNLGLNAGGEVGLASMREVMAGAIRAAQIEGGEIDVGQYFEFARRAKVAGPALSDEFLATTAPAIMQDMTASGAGNALAMLFKSFVLGDASINGKVYKARQRDLGIRGEDGEIVDGNMLGQNPYQWTKAYLVPALQAAGVDLSNETDVAAAVGKLSGNTNATGLLTRMITQSDQIERLIGMYSQAMGPEAGDQARERDPFVTLKGLTSSLGNLSAAMGEHVMPVIIPALNTMTDTINSMAAGVRGAGGLEVGLGSLALLIGTIGAWKVGTAAIGGLIALTTAGPSLQTAAIMLQGAATSLGGQGLPGAGQPKGKGGGLLGGLATTITSLAVAGGPGILSEMTSGSPSSIEEFDAQVAEQGRIKQQMWSAIDDATSWMGGWFNPTRTPGSSGMVGEQAAADMSTLKAEAMSAEAILNSLTNQMNGVNSPVSPRIDTADLERALGVAQRLAAALQSIGGITARQGAAARQSIDGLYSDYGVTP
ncbi:hypothetical protein JP75_06690 [Devosia riboflavina]|uniref:Uncharacterized protein n=1 Tax=Devosia riboflavina TaxID=46914 RepID=A0A087M4E1_9HYPH|nr:hypothetical protein [Devosia riboflavina]KFL31744.1 hypothetical protein JP75_06690 [Devosia riboflavina]